MREQVTVQGPILALQPLLLRRQAAESRRDEADDIAREGVPGEGKGGTLPTDELAELFREQDHVQKWLDEVDVQRGEARGPLLRVLGQPLVRIGNAVVQVADLVVVHVAQVRRVEILRQSLPVHQGELFLDVIDARVDRR